MTPRLIYRTRTSWIFSLKPSLKSNEILFLQKLSVWGSRETAVTSTHPHGKNLAVWTPCRNRKVHRKLFLITTSLAAACLPKFSVTTQETRMFGSTCVRSASWKFKTFLLWLWFCLRDLMLYCHWRMHVMLCPQWCIRIHVLSESKIKQTITISRQVKTPSWKERTNTGMAE